MLTLPRHIYEEMIAHSRRAHPLEACGLVAGREGKAAYFIPTRNIDESSESYALDSREQLRVFRQIERDGFGLLAIFHSHPASEAVPSQKDRQLAFYPETSYLILSLADEDKPELKSYRLSADGRMHREEVSIL